MLEQQLAMSGVPEQAAETQPVMRRLGRYRLGRRLGSGGAASVYLGLLEGPHGFERVLAVKVIHEHLLDQEEFVDMFLDEANLVVRLSHPNIVHVYELGREGDSLFLAMEYLRGQPLSKLQARARRVDQPLALDIVAWIGARAAEALHYAHDLKDDAGQSLGLVHRDVSPDNLFITYEGRVKLIDFGIARARGRAAQTGLGGIKGKYRYMSPEQALGRDLDRRSDIFALGATLYEAITGIPVFAADDEVETVALILEGNVPHPASQRPDVPEALANIVLKALATEVEDRYENGRELAAELDAFVAQNGRPPQQDRLAELIRDLFHKDIEAEEQAVMELKRLGEGDGNTAATQVAAEVVSDKTARPGMRHWPLLLLVLGALLAAPVLLRGSLGSSDPEPAGAAAPAASVTIDVAVQPKVAATIEVEGQPAAGSPARLTLSRSEEPLAVVARADGYEVAELTVIPDHDQYIVLPLIKAAAAPGSGSAGAAASAGPPAAVAPSQTATASQTPEPAGSVTPPGPSGARSGTAGAGAISPELIKRFPFEE